MPHALLFFVAIAASLSVGHGADAPPRGSATQASDADGNTPLHLAVLRHDPDAVETMLAQGANAVAVNAAGVTPLHYATANERMVTALLAHGAPVNAISKQQLVVFGAGGLFAHAPTPLGLAVLHPESYAVVRRLVEAGANVKYRHGRETSLILNLAITGGDRRTVELLFDRGAEVDPAEGSLPIVEAAFGGDIELVKLLLARGATVNGRETSAEIQPLSAALLWNHDDVARLLIERGANPNARLPFSVRPPNMVLSAYNDARDPTIARLLVERGVDINAADDNGETALSYALKRGSDGPLVAYLREAGATYSVVQKRAKTIPSREVPADVAGREAMVRDGVQRAINLIQPSSRAFLQVPLVRDQQKCTSCHQQALPNFAMSLARERGLRVDEKELGRALHALVSEYTAGTEVVRQIGVAFPPMLTFRFGFDFDALRAFGFAPNAATDAIGHSLLNHQRSDGSWKAPVRRPPLEDGALVATAWGARALQLYPPAGRERDATLALDRIRSWLARQQPRNLNDRVFQLLGIAWTNETVERLRPLAEQLIAAQSPDGGWAQFPTLEGDAWATGSVLVALHKADIPTSHPAYQRGVTFLLRTQFDDGSWWIRSRSLPFQPHFNGGFRHGKDEWISAAGTSWAMIALLLTLDPTIDRGGLKTAKELIAAFEASPPEKTTRDRVAAMSANPTATMSATMDFARDIKPLFERSCVECHSGESPKGFFDITSRAGLLKGGQSGEPAVMPGYADDSPLIRYVSEAIEDFEMPPLNRRHKYPALRPEEIEQLRIWIDAGAPWPSAKSVNADTVRPAGFAAGGVVDRDR